MLLLQQLCSRSGSSAASANGSTMTFSRPLYTHGFSLLQSGRIKRRRGGRRRTGQRLTMHRHNSAQKKCRPPAHVVAAVAVGRRRRHRNEIDKTRRASDSQTSIIQCDRRRATGTARSQQSRSAEALSNIDDRIKHSTRKTLIEDLLCSGVAASMRSATKQTDTDAYKDDQQAPVRILSSACGRTTIKRGKTTSTLKN